MHAHFLPEFYCDALLAAGQVHPDGIKAIPAWDEKSAVATMDGLGIATSFLSISSPGVYLGDAAQAADLARRVNEEAARLARAHEGRFGFFASLPAPDMAASLAELHYALDDLGADGIVLQTHQQGVYLGDDLLQPLYAALAERESTLFIHPTSPWCATDHALGRPRPMLEFMFETTRSVTDLILSGTLDRHPSLKVIVPHAGAALPVLAGRIELLLPMLASPGSGTAPSIRRALRGLYFDVAGAPVPELLHALLQVADREHLLYGSDWPFTPEAVARELARDLDRAGNGDEGIPHTALTQNAQRLFPRLTHAKRR